VIREERDPAFWTAVYEHPDVKPHVCLGRAVDLAPLLAHERVLPFRADHGGFLFVQLDGLGRVHELHTMFTPEGWGREALIAAKHAFAEVFARGGQIVTTYEVRGNPRSQPPLSFRFERAGEFARCDALEADLRSWVLTRNAWEASPARRRMQCL
jgi:hypothetical protein